MAKKKEIIPADEASAMNLDFEAEIQHLLKEEEDEQK